MLTVYTGDALEQLKQIPDESVHCCVTSPPYYGLRDYGVDGQIGLESTPEAYVAEMVAVFREVRRVLRSDGTLWLNLGDSYAGSGKGGNPENSPWSGFVGNGNRERAAKASPPIIPYGMKPKDLLGIPWAVAFALRADGWYLRSEIIWHKPNAMPESVTDRPTKSHEQIFLLAKGQWKTSIVQMANLGSERCHLFKNFGLSPDIAAATLSPSAVNYSPFIQSCA